MPTTDDIATRFAQACAFMDRGQVEEARQAYLDLLARAPGHAGALNNLGTLLLDTGYRSAARTAYSQAVATHPNDPVGHVNLGNLLLAEGLNDEARAHFEQALRSVPGHAEAHRGLSYCFTMAGDEAEARKHRDAAFTGRAIVPLPFRGESAGIPVLVLVGARGGNIPTHFLLDNRLFAVTVAVADYIDPDTPLPVHSMVFNTVGDADLDIDALLAAQKIVARTKAPVINRPERIVGTGRAETARRLAAVPGLRTPQIEMLPRDAATELELARRGFRPPFLLRAPGFHTGRHFHRVERGDQLGPVLATMPGPYVMAIEALDARGADGLWRKYRAMMVDGQLYPLHLAVAHQWKVHYFSSAMADRPDLRAEEAAFLTNMPKALGRRAMAALEGIAETLGLDYGGIDFGIDAQGNVLLFEANATMVVNPPEPDPRWDYRRAPVQRVLDAVRVMLLERANHFPAKSA
jgi:hypothetical protein